MVSPPPEAERPPRRCRAAARQAVDPAGAACPPSSCCRVGPRAQQVAQLVGGCRASGRGRRTPAGPAPGWRCRPGARRRTERSPRRHVLGVVPARPRAIAAARQPGPARRLRRSPGAARVASCHRASSSAADLGGDGRERLGQRVDRLGERPPVGRGELAVERVPEWRAAAVAVEAVLHRGEPRGDRPPELPFSLGRERGAQQLEGLPGAGEVGLRSRRGRCASSGPPRR